MKYKINYSGGAHPPVINHAQNAKLRKQQLIDDSVNFRLDINQGTSIQQINIDQISDNYKTIDLLKDKLNISGNEDFNTIIDKLNLLDEIKKNAYYRNISHQNQTNIPNQTNVPNKFINLQNNCDNISEELDDRIIFLKTSSQAQGTNVVKTSPQAQGTNVVNPTNINNNKFIHIDHNIGNTDYFIEDIKEIPTSGGGDRTFYNVVKGQRLKKRTVKRYLSGIIRENIPLAGLYTLQEVQEGDSDINNKNITNSRFNFFYRRTGDKSYLNNDDTVNTVDHGCAIVYDTDIFKVDKYLNKVLNEYKDKVLDTRDNNPNIASAFNPNYANKVRELGFNPYYNVWNYNDDLYDAGHLNLKHIGIDKEDYKSLVRSRSSQWVFLTNKNTSQKYAVLSFHNIILNPLNRIMRVITVLHELMAEIHKIITEDPKINIIIGTDFNMNLFNPNLDPFNPIIIDDTKISNNDNNNGFTDIGIERVKKIYKMHLILFKKFLIYHGIAINGDGTNITNKSISQTLESSYRVEGGNPIFDNTIKHHTYYYDDNTGYPHVYEEESMYTEPSDLTLLYKNSNKLNGNMSKYEESLDYIFTNAKVTECLVYNNITSWKDELNIPVWGEKRELGNDFDHALLLTEYKNEDPSNQFLSETHLIIKNLSFDNGYTINYYVWPLFYKWNVLDDNSGIYIPKFINISFSAEDIFKINFPMNNFDIPVPT